MKWLRFPRVLGLAVCLYLFAMAVLFGFLSTESFRFVRNATATEGTVVGFEIKRPAGSQRDPNPHSPNLPLAPRVRYVVNGTTYYYVAAHGRFHQRLVVGDPVTILYDPSDPSSARLRGEGRVLVPLITSAFATTAVALAAFLFLTRDGMAALRRSESPKELQDGEIEPDDLVAGRTTSALNG